MPGNSLDRMDSIRRLAGGFAHDLNNLLMIINGYSALLHSRGELNEDVRSDLATILRAGERASMMTAELLNISGSSKVASRTVVFDHALALIEPKLKKILGTGIDLTYDVKVKDVVVTLDPAGFDNVISNLIVNARDAVGEEGSVRLGIELTTLNSVERGYPCDLEPGTYATISVCDSGPLIPANVLDKFFEPYFASKQLGRGSGLGLTTVASIVNQAGGSVSIVSEATQGNSIKVRLPLPV